MASALENGHPSYRPTFRENLMAVLAPFEAASHTLTGVTLPTLTVKELTRMGRGIRLKERDVARRAFSADNSPMGATLEDLYGNPVVTGDLEDAALEAAPGKRVARRTGGRYFVKAAVDLGMGRLRLRPPASFQFSSLI